MMLRWGIVGASKISHDFCVALRSSLSDVDHEIVAVASRSIENATKFASKHKIPQVYGSYIELAQNSDVEAVYIAVLNPQHFEVSKLMIQHGKHVLCEKPFAMNYAQAKELADLAAAKGVFIMEGLWSRFFPVYRHLSQLIKVHSSDIKEVYVKHGFCGSNSQRIVSKNMGGGIVLDIGCYALQLVLFVYREAPKSVKAKGKINSDGVDLYFEAELNFSEGRKAFIICSGLESLENQATIITTKGVICIPNYWCPTKYIAFDEMHQWDLIPVQEELYYTSSVGLKYEADEVSKCIRLGQLQCDIAPISDTLLIAKIQDEIRKQIGVQYDCDKI